jgi:superoxide dismutase, Fe-Mn family
MEIRHDKHHQAHVSNLNQALKAQPDHSSKPIEDLLKGVASLRESIRTAVRNNGSGHYNHTLFWSLMKPKGGGEPRGALADAITKDLGGFAAFKEAFSKAVATRFGSGWAWLIRGRDGRLTVTSTANQDNPLMDGSGSPLLGLDVWEHAYYLKYRNRRPEYVAAWWNPVNWDEVDRRFRGLVCAGPGWRMDFRAMPTLPRVMKICNPVQSSSRRPGSMAAGKSTR